jgi:hypothetical protein
MEEKTLLVSASLDAYIIVFIIDFVPKGQRNVGWNRETAKVLHSLFPNGT